MRALFDMRLIDFHQSYIDDISWLNEYMAGLCEGQYSKGYVLFLQLFAHA